MVLILIFISLFLVFHIEQFKRERNEEIMKQLQYFSDAQNGIQRPTEQIFPRMDEDNQPGVLKLANPRGLRLPHRHHQRPTFSLHRLRLQIPLLFRLHPSPP